MYYDSEGKRISNDMLLALKILSLVKWEIDQMVVPKQWKPALNPNQLILGLLLEGIENVLEYGDIEDEVYVKALHEHKEDRIQYNDIHGEEAYRLAFASTADDDEWESKLMTKIKKVLTELGWSA